MFGIVPSMKPHQPQNDRNDDREIYYSGGNGIVGDTWRLLFRVIKTRHLTAQKLALYYKPTIYVHVYSWFII